MRRMKRESSSMNEADTPVRVTLRIPGNWSRPRELIQRIPAGYRLTAEALLVPRRETGWRRSRAGGPKRPAIPGRGDRQ